MPLINLSPGVVEIVGFGHGALRLTGSQPSGFFESWRGSPVIEANSLGYDLSGLLVSVRARTAVWGGSISPIAGIGITQ